MLAAILHVISLSVAAGPPIPPALGEYSEYLWEYSEYLYEYSELLLLAGPPIPSALVV